VNEREYKFTFVEPVPGMCIGKSVVLKSGVYEFSSGEGIIIRGENITIDGNGAIFCGPGSLDKGTKSFKGTGIIIERSKNIVLKNFVVKGFQKGLHVIESDNIIIENNDFSDNFTDPEYGWGDGEPYGAILMEYCNGCTIKNNKGNNVWNGLNLRYCYENEVIENTFSHCSNVCLLLWGSSRNVVRNNNLSWGLRIKPGEVHARDSACLLVEHGSNDNRFYNNDFTHGGDGIFIRSLDGVISTGNYFEGNNCSYANNNAIECWSPGNTFVKNIANNSSYGFWMGGSDHTLIQENEIAYNGTNFHNAPEKDFGNAGVAVVHGSSNHCKLIGNNIHDNNGPGVAIGFKKGYPAYHWVIQHNVIQNNTSHGIYLRDSKWMNIGGNIIKGNGGEEIYYGQNVSDIFVRTVAPGEQAPCARVKVSAHVIPLGAEVVFDALGSTDPEGRELTYRWELGDGTIAETAVVRHRYERPGLYKVGLTVSNGKLADIVGLEIYVYKHGQY